MNQADTNMSIGRIKVTPNLFFIVLLLACKAEMNQADTNIKQSQMKLKSEQAELKKKQSELKKTEKDYKKDSENLAAVQKSKAKLEVCRLQNKTKIKGVFWNLDSSYLNNSEGPPLFQGSENIMTLFPGFNYKMYYCLELVTKC